MLEFIPLHHVILHKALLCSLELNTLDAGSSRSMCGVIVVDACRSRSTRHRRDAYIHNHCLGYRHNFALFYQLLNSNLFTHRMLYSREKPLVKPMAPGSIFHHTSFRSTILFSNLLFLQYFTFRSINQKYQKYLLYRLSIFIRSHFCK